VNFDQIINFKFSIALFHKFGQNSAMKNMYQNHPEIYEIDRKRKKRTRNIIILVAGGVILLVTLLIFGVFSLMKSSEAYKTAVETIKNDPKVLAKTGGIEDIGMFGGSINTTNGYGTASLSIPVDGKDQDVDVYIELEKTPNTEWNVITMSVE